MKDRMGNIITKRDYSWVKPLIASLIGLTALGALIFWLTSL